jgi:hypothetical protein
MSTEPSVFSKMLAYAVVSNDDYIDDAEMREIIDGSIFDKYNIGNFVENDFFYWVKNEQSFPKLREAFRAIRKQLSAFDFQNVDEDVLKGIYQEMIELAKQINRTKSECAIFGSLQHVWQRCLLHSLKEGRVRL